MVLRIHAKTTGFTTILTPWYSAPPRYAGKWVVVRGYADRVTNIFNGRQVARHKKLFGRSRAAYDSMHYLDVLEKKPGAIQNGVPFMNWRLPEAFETVRDNLRAYETDVATGKFVKLLLIRHCGLENATSALAIVLEESIVRAGYVENWDGPLWLDRKLRFLRWG